MAGYDGNGNWTRSYSWTQDANNGLFIDASRMDTEWANITNAFNNCLTRDGQGKPSAAINWNGQNLTNVGTFTATSLNGPLNGTASGNLPNLGGTVQNFTNAGPAVTVLGAGTNQGWLRLGSNLDIQGGADYLGVTFTYAGTILLQITGSGVTLNGTTTLANPLAIGQGGTGATTAAAARTALGGNAIGNRFVQAIGSDPTSAVGDIVYEY